MLALGGRAVGAPDGVIPCVTSNSIIINILLKSDYFVGLAEHTVAYAAPTIRDRSLPHR